jgi:nucleotide-binding universal stress UspA family protein
MKQHPLRKIMVATDGSETSMRAAEMAVEMAHHYGAELLAVHVVDEEVLREFCRVLGKDEEQARATLAADGEKYLQEVRNLAEHKVRIATAVEHGTPHEALLRVAQKEKVDLIVMGKIGRRGPRRILMGSVTQRVIDLAEIPVLVVK